MAAFDTYTINHIDNDLTNASNWSNGVPTSDEKVLFQGPYTFNTHMDFGGGVDDLTIHVADNYSGKCGTSGNPLTVGTSNGGTILYYNGPLCPGFHINATMAAAYILNTYPSEGSFSIEGGTTTLLICHGGRGGILAAAGTYTTVVVDGPTAYLQAEDGNTITTAKAMIGTLKSSTQITNSYVKHGLLYLEGSSKTYAVLDLDARDGIAYLHCPGSTVTQITANAGTVDAMEGAKEIVVTNATCYSQGNLLYGPHVTETNPPVVYGGGGYHGSGSPIYKTPPGGGIA